MTDPTTDLERERGFEATALQQKRRLFGLAVSILRDRGEAEDAVQETLVKAWKAWDTLGDTQQIGPWLTKVCINHCISRRRGLISRGWLHRQALPPSLSAPTTPRMSGELLDLDRAYRRLSIRQRTALTLNYRHGHSVDECGALMGCSAGTVRSHVARALEKLREEIRDV